MPANGDCYLLLADHNSCKLIYTVGTDDYYIYFILLMDVTFYELLKIR